MNKTMIAMALFAMALGSDVNGAKQTKRMSPEEMARRKQGATVDSAAAPSSKTPKQKAADTAKDISKDILDGLGKEETEASSASAVEKPGSEGLGDSKVTDAPAPPPSVLYSKPRIRVDIVPSTTAPAASASRSPTMQYERVDVLDAPAPSGLTAKPPEGSDRVPTPAFAPAPAASSRLGVGVTPMPQYE